MTARWNALFGGISSARISEAVIRSDFVRALSPAGGKEKQFPSPTGRGIKGEG